MIVRIQSDRDIPKTKHWMVLHYSISGLSDHTENYTALESCTAVTTMDELEHYLMDQHVLVAAGLITVLDVWGKAEIQPRITVSTLLTGVGNV